MAGTDNFRLVMRRGPQPNQVYDLTKDVTNLGRDITNDIVINDREASRHHLRIMRSGDGYVVEDLGSTNGTFVNGKRITTPTNLKNGDMVGMGETVTLGFEVLSTGGSSTVASSPPSYAGNPSPAPSASPYQAPSPVSSAPSSPAYSDANAVPSYQAPQQPQSSYASGGGYDYSNEYPVYEEEERGGRWVVLGCIVFFLLACACIAVVGLIIIDQLRLWCELPVIDSIANMLGGNCFPS